MYTRKVTANVKVLSNKTIPDAAQYITTVDIKSSVIVYIIGSNDLTVSSAHDVAVKCKDLILTTKKQFANSKVVYYGVPPRKHDEKRWPDYEGKRKELNECMEKFCSETERIFFAESTVSMDQISHDKIHVKHTEVKTIITDLKKVLNPLLGLKPYTEYPQSGSINSQNSYNRSAHLPHNGNHQCQSGSGAAQRPNNGSYPQQNSTQPPHSRNYPQYNNENYSAHSSQHRTYPHQNSGSYRTSPHHSGSYPQQNSGSYRAHPPQSGSYPQQNYGSHTAQMPHSSSHQNSSSMHAHPPHSRSYPHQFSSSGSTNPHHSSYSSSRNQQYQPNNRNISNNNHQKPHNHQNPRNPTPRRVTGNHYGLQNINSQRTHQQSIQQKAAAALDMLIKLFSD